VSLLRGLAKGPSATNVFTRRPYPLSPPHVPRFSVISTGAAAAKIVERRQNDTARTQAREWRDAEELKARDRPNRRAATSSRAPARSGLFRRLPTKAPLLFSSHWPIRIEAVAGHADDLFIRVGRNAGFFVARFCYDLAPTLAFRDWRGRMSGR
jgi:hypothetical protein